MRKAVELGCSGYLPSLESFSFVSTEAEEGQSWLIGRRQQPFGFGWLQEDKSPYNEIPLRLNRLAYRAYSQNPNLTDREFRHWLADALCGDAGPGLTERTEVTRQELVDDALFLQSVFNTRRSWCQPGLLACPERVQWLDQRDQLDLETRKLLRLQLDQVQKLQVKYRSISGVGIEMATAINWLVEQWPDHAVKILREGP